MAFHPLAGCALEFEKTARIGVNRIGVLLTADRLEGNLSERVFSLHCVRIGR